MALPDTYSELYPGRFMKADMFKGQKATFTITNLDIEVLEGEKGREPKVVGTFTGPKKAYDHVIPKTVGFCLKRMFGNNPREWLNKRVTLYPTTTKFGRETVDCIRVWGSPDLSSDMSITIPQGRRKPLEAVMHKVKSGECGFKGDGAPTTTTPAPEEEIIHGDAYEEPNA
jgi:hypothetical protein